MSAAKMVEARGMPLPVEAALNTHQLLSSNPRAGAIPNPGKPEPNWDIGS
jgi:hypothetical protein